MKAFASIACLVLLASCASGPVIVPVADSVEPEKMEGEVNRDVREVPGAMYIQRARVAYLKFKDIEYKQKERESLTGRPAEAYIPDEHYEKLKEEYLAEAEKNLVKVFEVNHDSAMAHQLMGLIHLDREEFDKAEAQFREVLRIDPLAENALVNIAHAQWRGGNSKGAKESIAEALKINPSNRPALKLRDVIEEDARKKKAKDSEGDIPPFRPRLDR